MKYKLPHHDSKSHKGQAGKMLIVGGNNKYYGAPILTALGAENSGADLITLYLPTIYVKNARNYSLNLFINGFQKEYLSLLDIDIIISECKNQHALIIGNGLGKEEETKKAICKILEQIKIPAIIDAEALVPEILNIKKKSDWIITPHKREFKKLFNITLTLKNIQHAAKIHNITILVKGHVDIIASPCGKIYKNKTGCAEMRVGGTGDVLAGIIGSFVAQNISSFDACSSAVYHWGLCGEYLISKQEWLTARDMIKNFSKTVLKNEYPK